MPLKTKQTENIKAAVEKMYPNDRKWTAEGQTDGSCFKLVTIVPQIKTTEFQEITALIKKEKCDVTIKAISSGISLTFH